MIYRLLVRLLFPRRLFRAFGDDMVRMFDQQRAEVRATGGRTTRLWMSALWDALLHGTSDRIEIAREAVSGAVLQVRRWRWWMMALSQDLRYAWRLVWKQPGVTLLAVITLALGIGGNTAIFSAVDAVLLRPLPYEEPEKLVMVWEKRQAEGVLANVVAPADFLDWSLMNGAFEAMAGYSSVTADLTGTGEPIRLVTGAVSPAFFTILRVRPILGRNFLDQEAFVGNHRVVILGHPLWASRFGADPAIVGRSIVLNGNPHEVVGVLPDTFEFTDRTVQVWAPLALEGGKQPPTRSLHFLEVYARLKPGVTIERARADMDRVGAALQAAHPQTNREHGAHVVPLAAHLRQPVRAGLLLLLGAVGFVLLIACVNVANLLLARSAARRREMAVRVALGAGRARLAGQSLTESVVLGILGGAAGLIVAHWGIGLVRTLTPGGLRVPGLDSLGLNERVLLFTLTISIATGLIFGLLPAWQVATQDANDVLKEGGRTGSYVRRRLRTALVISEIALASFLLVGAGLTLRSFRSVLDAEAGVRTDHVLTAFVSLPAARYGTQEKRLATIAEIERRFASIPGVRAAGATSHLPLSGADSRAGVAIEGRAPTPDSPTRAHPRSVTRDYFSVTGMTLLSGRLFDRRDDTNAPPVVVVNETMARRYWQDTSPIGRRVRLAGTEEWREVVGVVRDVRHWGLDRPVNPEIYLPIVQYAWSSPTFVLATDADRASVGPAVREQLRAVDPDLPVSSIRTMEEVATESLASRRVSVLLLATFGGLALALAAAGIYSVMAHLVALRTSEIGVRLTLGARPSDVFRLVLREGMVQAVAGVAVGTVAGVLLMRAFRSLLYEISPADPLTLVGVALLLTGTALLACYLPARRAMKVDPVTALRDA
jgi:putative ABC transport system permease protein